MTQLIALANNRYSILLADRRITVDRRPVEDEFNKVCVLFCYDARVVISFTGLATYEAFNTSDWLVDTLSEIGDQTEAFAEILSALAQRARSKFKELLVKDRRLTFLITGFVYWEPAPRPIAYVLSNFSNTDSLVDEFVLRSIAPSDALIVEVAGAISQLPPAVESSVRKLLESNLDPSSVLRFAVKQLQNIASNGKSLGLVGTQSNSAIVPALPNTTITTTYHSAFNSNTAYGCNVVYTRGMRVYGSEIFSATIMAGPEIRKKDPCWCGSGQKFKHCHMKKFGSVYVRHPAFKKPMYAVSHMQFDAPRPSGNNCYVASGYQ